jgi:hypothetical protein
MMRRMIARMIRPKLQSVEFKPGVPSRNFGPGPIRCCRHHVARVYGSDPHRGLADIQKCYDRRRADPLTYLSSSTNFALGSAGIVFVEATTV